MKSTCFKKITVLCLSLFLCTFIFIACAAKDKQMVLSGNVSQQAKAEENEIEEKIKEGNKYLSEGKYEDAKQIYENAISIDKGNKESYLSIKDSYLDVDRLDDAFYIIKLAIENKVDIDNMKTQLEDIKKKFQVASLQGSIIENTAFTLPKTATVKVNNTDTEAKVDWSISSIDTSKAGTYTFEGIAEQYERPVKFVLTIKKNSNDVENRAANSNTAAQPSTGNNLKTDASAQSISEKNITEKVKTYIISGQGNRPEADKFNWSKTFLDRVDIVSIYKKYTADGGNGQDLRSFAKYMTYNAPIPSDWKELFKKDLYDSYGKSVVRLEYLQGDLYQAYVKINGSEVPYVVVSSRTGYYHG